MLDFVETRLTIGISVFPRFLQAITYVFPVMLMIAWVLFVADFVRKLVHERELRLHEVRLKMIKSATYCFFSKHKVVSFHGVLLL